MEIKTLDENLISKIRSSSNIESLSQCVNELVLNSLDAKSTSIAVRINLSTFRIQVIDNGKGISRSNLDFIGVRYMTNKCHTLEDLKKHLKFYGFKGEAIANICEISKKVTITSRELDSEFTYTKIIENKESRIELGEMRPSFGTTVTVDGFLNNLPVRQQCIKNSELENIKRNLENLVIIHPRISFTLRNDICAKVILSSVKCDDIASSFKTIHPEIDEKNFVLYKICKNKTKTEGLIHKQFFESKRLQYVYVNKRPINCPKVTNMINLISKKSQKVDKGKYLIFILHIKCPYSDVDINLEPTKTSALFKKFDIVKRCIEKMIKSFLGIDEISTESQKSKLRKTVSEFGISQIGGAVKCVGTKRKIDENSNSDNKSEKIIDDTPLFEEAKIPSKQTKTALPIEIYKKDADLIDNSIFTNFPENEKKGKDLIMDMFILSLKAFPAENSGNNQNQTLGIQTSQNMVSVGVQTENYVFEPVFETDFLLPRKSLKRCVSDYDFDFSKIDTFSFNFNKQPCDDFNQIKKLFDFENHRSFYGNQSFFNRSNFHQSTKMVDIIQSPYFFKKPFATLKKSPLKIKNQPQFDYSFNKLNDTKSTYKRKLDDSIVSKYFTTKKFKSRENKENIKTQSIDFEKSEDLFNLSSVDGSHLIITMNDEESKTEDIIIPQTVNNSVKMLKKDITFEIMERYDFVPKGLSPILKDYGKVEEMSPESKEHLQNAIVQSYEDELLLIKWQNCIDNKDPRKFFEEIYLEKSKLIEKSIPNINKSAYVQLIKGFEHMSFTKNLFMNLEVIGQVDKKFIATLDKTKNLILLFDQHAVHERVRLEELSQSYRSASTKLDQNITIFLPNNDLNLLQKQKNNVFSLGLVFDFFTNGVTIFEVPLCICNKAKKGGDIVKLTENLIKEVIDTLNSNNGIIVNTPKIIQNIINSEACRGAIKFGDSLTKNECIMHIKKLQSCELPFQCAHGRPTLTPLLFLKEIKNFRAIKPKLNIN